MQVDIFTLECIKLIATCSSTYMKLRQQEYHKVKYI
jgi:hypothetical protein